MRARIPLLLLFVSFPLLFACGKGGLRTGGPYPSDSIPAEGLRYYAARNVITVDARVISRRDKTEWTDACGTTVTPGGWRRTTYEVTTPVMPDRRQSFRLGIIPSRTVEQTFKVGVGDNGLLTSFNYAGQDRTAEIVGSIVRGVAGVAGTVLGIANMRTTLPGGGGGTRSLTEGSENQLNLPLPEHCAVRKGDERSVTLAGELLRLQQDLADAKKEHDNVLARAARTSSMAELRRLRAQDTLLTRREALLAERAAAARAALTVAATAFGAKKPYEIGGGGEDTVRITETFDLTEIPDETYSGTLAQALAGKNTSQGFWKFARETRIVLAVGEPRNGSAEAPKVENPQAGTGSLSCNGGREVECARIRYRQPVLRELRVYAPRGAETAPLQVQEARMLPLVSSADPILNIALDARAMGEGKAALAFGPYGNVTTLEQATNARLARATSTIADALTAARAEFVGGLQTAQTTQTTLISMRANARAEQIKQLTDQKALTDAQIALEGANANRDLIRQKQAIDAQLALLKAQQDLETSTRGSETTAELADVRAEIQRLQVQLELLQKQLELEKARAELDRARSGRE